LGQNVGRKVRSEGERREGEIVVMRGEMWGDGGEKRIFSTRNSIFATRKTIFATRKNHKITREFCNKNHVAKLFLQHEKR
jgi:hypothetical protein